MRRLRCALCFQDIGTEAHVLTQHGRAHERCSKARTVTRIAPLIAVETPNRLAQLRAMATSRPHECAAFRCDVLIPRDRLMCDDHWLLLPVWLRERLDAAHTPGAELRWPLDLVEQAIAVTMTTSDRDGLRARVEGSLQEDLLSSAEVA